MTSLFHWSVREQASCHAEARSLPSGGRRQAVRCGAGRDVFTPGHCRCGAVNCGAVNCGVEQSTVEQSAEEQSAVEQERAVVPAGQ